jgi:hypothetical protein
MTTTKTIRFDKTAPIARSYGDMPSRTMVTWTPARVRTAEALARSGNLWLAAKLCEDILADDRASGVLTTRVEGLLGLPLSFEAGVGRRRKLAVRALEAEEDFWAMFPEVQLTQLIAWGIVLGVGLGELIWSYRPNGRVIGRLKVWHTESLRFDWETRKWFLTIADGTEIEIVRGDPKWILFTPYGEERPWMHGAWRMLARWWLLKNLARDDFARHSEVHGSPARVGIGGEGTTREEVQALADDLANLGSETGIGIPEGWNVKLLEATSRSWEMFPAQVKLANDGITIALAGQNLTTEVSGASLAAAKVHQEIHSGKIRFDDEAVSTTLHDQPLAWWAEYNFGDRELAPWPLHDTEPPDDLSAKANGITALGNACAAVDAALAANGTVDETGTPLRVDMKALCELHEIPLTPRKNLPQATTPVPSKLPPLPALP